MADFLFRDVARFGRPLFRLGLSGTFGLDEAGCREALERVQYVFWSPRMKGLTPALRDALARDRGRYVVATGPLRGFFPGSLRKAVENARRTLGIDVIDVFQLFWLGKMSAFTGAVQAEMAALRAAGKVRWLAVSTHDRPRAGRLAADSLLDVLMIRYNAAHPGAEQEIFPHLAASQPGVVSYGDVVAQAPRRAQGLDRQDPHGGRLLSLLPLVAARRRRAHGAAHRRAAAGEPRRPGTRAALSGGGRLDARVRPGRARLVQRVPRPAAGRAASRLRASWLNGTSRRALW